MYTVDKRKVEISQIFVAFSEYTNFTSITKLGRLGFVPTKVGSLSSIEQKKW